VPISYRCLNTHTRRDEQWSGAGGFGSKIAKMKQTKVLKHVPISDQTWQRFRRMGGLIRLTTTIKIFFCLHLHCKLRHCLAMKIEQKLRQDEEEEVIDIVH
jgi:hypothetical protein